MPHVYKYIVSCEVRQEMSNKCQNTSFSRELTI